MSARVLHRRMLIGSVGQLLAVGIALLSLLTATQAKASPTACDIVASELMTLRSALVMYIAEHDEVPARTDWLKLLKREKLLHPRAFEVDPWGHEYVFSVRGVDVQVRSIGGDGVFGTADDQIGGVKRAARSCGSPLVPRHEQAPAVVHYLVRLILGGLGLALLFVERRAALVVLSCIGLDDCVIGGSVEVDDVLWFGTVLFGQGMLLGLLRSFRVVQQQAVALAGLALVTLVALRMSWLSFAALARELMSALPAHLAAVAAFPLGMLAAATILHCLRRSTGAPSL